jgi:hypothetical protein
VKIRRWTQIDDETEDSKTKNNQHLNRGKERELPTYLNGRSYLEKGQAGRDGNARPMGAAPK